MCFRSDTPSSDVSMFLLVARGESGGCAAGMTLICGNMIGRAEGFDESTSNVSSSGDAGIDGPFGVDVLDRCIIGIDREAAFCIAAARCVSWRPCVMMERRELRFTRDSTLGNVSGLKFSSVSASSSHSSSSMALSEISSDSYSSSSSSLSMALPSSALVERMNFFFGISVTFSKKEVCFLW